MQTKKAGWQRCGGLITSCRDREAEEKQIMSLVHSKWPKHKTRRCDDLIGAIQQENKDQQPDLKETCS